MLPLAAVVPRRRAACRRRVPPVAIVDHQIFAWPVPS
jgi:hypothetical protein